jgi:hypothetical protein
VRVAGFAVRDRDDVGEGCVRGAGEAEPLVDREQAAVGEDVSGLLAVGTTVSPSGPACTTPSPSGRPAPAPRSRHCACGPVSDDALRKSSAKTAAKPAGRVRAAAAGGVDCPFAISIRILLLALGGNGTPPQSTAALAAGSNAA